MNKMLCCLLFLILTGLTPGAHAANQYWDPATNAGYQHADGVWSTAAGDTNWGVAATGARSTWANNNRAYFSATGGTSRITLSSSITATGFVMNGSAYTLVITNGGVLSSTVSTPTISASNNSLIVTGQGVLWDFNNNGLSLGNNTTATNNTLTIDQGGAIANVGTLNVGKSNSLQLFGGTLSVSNVTWNTNELFTAGDGVQAATLTARGGTITFQNGVLVSSNASLKGSGTVNGNSYGVVMTNGATLTGGETNTITTMTLRDSVTFYGGATLNLNVTNVTGIAGTDWDLVRVIGNLSVIPNGGKLKIVLDSLGETAGGFDPATSRIVPLITFSSSSLSLSDIEVDTNKFLIGGNWSLETTATDLRYVYRRPSYQVYVSPGGNELAGTNWTTAFTSLTNAWPYVQNGDTVYMAGQTFLTTQIVLNARDGVSILGGYEAASDAVLPGPNDPAQWPTTLKRDPGVAESRILYLSGLTNGVIKDLTIRDGYIYLGGVGAGVYIVRCESLTLDSCVIISNNFRRGDSRGAGAYVASGSVNITNSLIAYNSISPGDANSESYGGGLYLSGGTTTVGRSRIIGNFCRGQGSGTSRLAYGGGVYVNTGAAGIMRETVIATNTCVKSSANANTRGGGISNSGGLLLENCLIVRNADENRNSDGIYSSGNLTLMNCTVADNGGTNGYGIRYAGGTIGMTNSIVWGHKDDIYGFPNDGQSPPMVSNVFYCCIQDGEGSPAQGCIALDPLFVDTTYYHLQSTASNYVNGYFSGGTWGTSLSNSPAIDKGDPGIIPTAEPMPNKGIVNMGYDGNTDVASLSPTISATLPAITNRGATTAGHRTVTLNAEVTDTGGDTPTCGFEYWITGSAVTSTASAGPQTTLFLNPVGGLTPNSAYQFRAVASNLAGAAFSFTNTFNTHPVPSSFYVATNGNNTAGTNWSTAFTDPQAAFIASEAGDSIYLAGHTFAKGPDLNAVSLWTWSGASNVIVEGGYQAVGDAVLPGPNDPTQWPTVLKRSSGVARILRFSDLTSSTLRGVTIEGGSYSASAGYGGGLYATGCSRLMLDACVFTNNVIYGNAGRGGGLYTATSSLLVTNCLFTRNTARGVSASSGYGGGVFVASGDMTMTMSRVETNSAQGLSYGEQGLGGGLYFASGSTGVITRTVVSRNRAFSGYDVSIGGGVYNGGGRVTLQNCLVVLNDSGNNVADGIYSSSGSMNILNCTVADNSGVGIQVAGGTAGLTNSIVWGNGDDLTGTVSVAYCDIGTADDFWTNLVNGCISENPLFVDTVYYHLQSKSGNYLGGYFSGGTGWGTSLNNSPCIDTGYPDPAKPWMGEEPEPNGGRSNMGAYGNTTVASKGFSAGTLFMLR